MLGLDFIKKLKPAIFKYKADTPQGVSDKKHFGFIAQDIAEILDDKNKYAILKKDENGYYLVDHGEIIAPLVKAVQELSDKVDRLSRGENSDGI